MAGRRTHQLTRIGHRLALVLILAAIGALGFVYGRWVYRERRFNALIQEIAGRQGVDQFLVKAVIRRESKFDPFVRGRAGEIGLMQVTPAAGVDWARATGRPQFQADQLWEPRLNIEAGTWYLGRALRRWNRRDDPVPFALAEYNAGLGNVRRWLPHGDITTAAEFQAAITYPTVREYIAAVTNHYAHYRQRGKL